MRSRTTRGAAVGGALTLVAGMGTALLSQTPALAGTGGGGVLCAPTTLAPSGTPNVPIGINVTASPSSPVFPTGASIPVNGATVTLTLPGAVVGGTVAQTGATAIGLSNAIINLAASNATGTLSATGLSAPTVAVTGYNATGGPGGTPTADPIQLTVNNVNFGHATSAGTDGGHSDITLNGSAATGDGFILSLTGSALAPSLGFGSLNTAFGGPGPGDCSYDATDFGPNATIATVNYADPPPVVAANSSYGAVAGINNDLQVSATDNDGTGVDSATWQIANGPTCTTGPGNGSATVTGTAGIGTVHFTAPPQADTCTIGVTVKDTNGGTSNVATLHINVVAGANALQGVTQNVGAGNLSLVSCGITNNTDPAACNISMSDITLNGQPQTSTGAINRVTVIDARGAPVPWSLTAQLAGDLTNTNSSLSGPHTKIPSANLKLSPSCSNDPSNTNNIPAAGAAAQTLDAAAATPAAICAATAGQNTGTFFADGLLSLDIPPTVYAGTYTGTINFVVS